MRLIPIILLLTLSYTASATTYYVSSSSGNDANSGTSVSTPWQTVAHVNGQTFLPGDSILFRRGDVWNESLAPPSSGGSGNPITFDAYGAGAAPNLTGYYAVPPSAWVLVTGNAWKAALPATFSTINFCLFGSIWGQKVAAATSNLTVQRNFYLANGFVYVYSVGNPATYYNQPIVPMALSNVPVINVNGKSWLTFQHFLVNWFDQYGVYVQGNSDHLVFANMEADSMIPQGAQPLGFYVNEGAPGPGDIKIYNVEAHMNYDGFRFDGAAIGITLVNDKAYGNRDGALVDNTSAVTYSHCHFYGSSLAVAGSTDVEWTSGTGPIAGAGNIAQDTAPAVQVWQRYPAEVTLTVDDAGMTAGADTYYANTVLPIADAASVPVGVAVTVGYPLAQTLVSEFQGWVNAGRDVTSHSISHTYYTNTDALEIQYTGSGTAATLSISNKTLTITVTGASDGVSYNLAQGQAQGTIKGLRLALAATGKFTATEIQTCQGPYGTGCSAYTEAALLAQDLADVSGQDVRTSVYHMQLDVTRLTTDEITLSRQWMTTNLTGLPATAVYVYPGGYETPTMQGITGGVPYAGARGALKEDLGVKDTYASGFDVQNITSFGVNPSWQGLQAATLNQKIQALVWKQRVWGVPWGIFWHLNELSSTEITNLIQDLKTSGATIQTNTSLVNWLLGGTQEAGTDGNSYYALPATSTTLDFRPSKNSPVVDAGQNLGAAYALDINGVNQNSYGSQWEIGAHVYEGYAAYGEAAGAGTFKIGLATGCGGLLYLCGNQTTAPIQTPTPPAFTQTGINTYGYDNSIVGGMPYLMATDSNSDPSHYPVGSTSAGSDSESEWNCVGRGDWSTACGNATLRYYQGNVEGTALLFEFDPSRPPGSQIVNPVPSPSMFIATGGSSGWSHADPQTFYARSGGTDQKIYKYVFNSTLTSYVKTLYVDLGLCPGISNSTYQTQPPVWVLSGVLSIADGTDNITLGQGTTNWVVHWVASTNSCAALNTATGNYWGYCNLSSGCSTVAPAGTEPYQVYNHQTPTNQNGTVSLISWDPPCPGTCPATGFILWSWDNPTLFAGTQYYNCLGSLGCNGHSAFLNGGLIPGNDPNPKRLYWSNPAVLNPIDSVQIHAVGAPAQEHFSYMSIDAADTNPIMVSMASPLSYAPWTTPYQGELFMLRYQGVGTYGIGTTARCCHTFSASSPYETFEAEDAIWTISPDGVYAIGNSSMQCTLGQSPESSSVSTVNTAPGSGSTGVVTWVSGKTFDTGGCGVGFTVVINGNPFTIQSITDSTHLVTTTSPGTLTGVTASINEAWSALFIVGPLTRS